MDGSRKNVEDYKDCYLAKEPARAVIGRMDADSQQIYKVLSQVFHATLLLKKDPVIVLRKGVILI